MFTFDDTLLVKEYACLGAPFVRPTPVTPLSQPAQLVHANGLLAESIGIHRVAFENPAFIQILTGQKAWPSYDAVASVYCGHQFGVFVPQLGDGRALTIAELRRAGKYQQLQLKGAGPTPYSRHADGRAVLRSSIREYIASEAMHALGIPTTRALSLTATSDPVFRETTETAAVVCRTSSSFLRFGHVEYFASVGQISSLEDLLEWQIEHHHPHLLKNNEFGPDVILSWLAEVCERTARLVAKWQSVGFCHGVMNSDNMSLLGETIDYGPYGFMDGMQVDHICNHSDHNGRYSYRNQPRIAHWNCYALAQGLVAIEGLSPEKLQPILDKFPAHFESAHTAEFARKLGLSESGTLSSTQTFIEKTLGLMHTHGWDFTRFFRSISALNPMADVATNWATWQADTFFAITLGDEAQVQSAKDWLSDWIMLVSKDGETGPIWAAKLNQINPAVVPRNHLLQQAIEMAQTGKFEEVGFLFDAVTNPYQINPARPDYYADPPAWASEIELSCSS